MRYVLFYSNRCDHSRGLLALISKLPVAEETSFVCVDSRRSSAGKSYAILDAGKEVPLPSNLVSVPALLLLEKSNALIVGDEIKRHLDNEFASLTSVANDPTAFSFSEMAGLSDGYAYLDLSAEEMMAQGTGGQRIMHSFASLGGHQSITTPQQVDDEAPKLKSVNMDDLLARRASEVPPAVIRE